MNHEKNKSLLTKWLNKLQEESWNLELLISGFSIFGLFQILEAVKRKSYHFRANYEETEIFYSSIQQLLTILYIGILIFIICLLCHVFLRGLWIGAIGLRYVSGEIDYDNLKYNERFKSYLIKKVGSFDDFILRLEKIASSIFAFTYLLFFSLLSFFMFIIITGLLGRYLFEIFGTELSNLSYKMILLTILIFGGIVALDFLTLGLLKRIKYRWFTAIYFPIYIFITYLTLSFIWRPLLYNFVDHKYTKWIAACTVPLLVGLVVFMESYYNKLSFYPIDNYEIALFESIYYKEHSRFSFSPEFYDDLREKEKEKNKYSVIKLFSIPKYKISESILDVFVKYDSKTENLIMALDTSIEKINKIGISLGQTKSGPYADQYQKRLKNFKDKFNSTTVKNQFILDSVRSEFIRNEQERYRSNYEKINRALKKIYLFEINGIKVPHDSVSINYFIHPNFEEKGFICSIPTSFRVQNGTNYLTLKKRFNYESSKKYYYLDFTIPFLFSKSLNN